MPTEFNPLRLDVAALAQAGAAIAGEWPVQELPRLTASAHPDTPPGAHDRVRWSAQGLQQRRAGAAPEPQLRLQAATGLRLQCQRCLQPVDEVVQLERLLRFAPSENEAAALDIDSEDDVLALSKSLDLRELVEDELLLALPLVPRHAECPLPLPAADAPAPDEAARANPFAVLAALKRDRDPGAPH